ncbi:hypothetical protein OMQ_02137 [Enterococcus saccharolyticus subsp. saccharolyticus ATCC 43076]|uniref:Uncharacterized protein n=2 Tax=Enterococcus saccharolyticus TaxID=41997 RepID=S0J2C9_9ENTE|nr:hypothetical protein OMQ_02137 [Enterococcus saccharolyticus subsp. saccharolyticus ATCC 43076]EOT76322.1 hypothetical protein I572_02510 [Enterococcus saccharolyticus subsp. saccharolyticus ATCC 43076]
MNKKFLLSMVVNLVLIGGIGGLLFEKQQSNQRLNATILHDTIYRAKHGDDSWNTQRPEGYYLFADEEYITVKTFGQKQLMKASIRSLVMVYVNWNSIKGSFL